jgi:Family of unknown function (DUF6334)
MSGFAKEIVDSYGRLIEVREGDWLGASGPVALTLGFEHGVVLVRTDADDDTITLTSAGPASGRDVSTEPPWRDAIGRGLLWVWTLTNQQGFEDGCQFEFGQVGPDAPWEPLCIQLMVAAATLHISTVNAL